MMMPSDLNAPQPAPAPNGERAVWDLVIEDMHARDGEGARKYGTRLRPFDGRSSLIDAYQEALDLAVYLRKEVAERERLAAQLDDALAGLGDPDLDPRDRIASARPILKRILRGLRPGS